jgi:hypothetical protein
MEIAERRLRPYRFNAVAGDRGDGNVENFEGGVQGGFGQGDKF